MLQIINVIKNITFILIVLILITTITNAGTSLNGPTGLILMPTAESLKYKEFNISADYIFPAGNNNEDNYIYKLNLGTFQNWEVGVVGGKTPTEGMYLNIKYYLMSSESELPLFIAIGVQNFSSTQKTDVYMVASKKVREDFGVHFGFKAIFNTEITPVFITGINYIVSEKLELLADITPAIEINGSAETYIGNIGANYYISPNLSINMHLLDITSQTTADKNTPMENGGMNILLGVTYSKFL